MFVFDQYAENYVNTSINNSQECTCTVHEDKPVNSYLSHGCCVNSVNADLARLDTEHPQSDTSRKKCRNCCQVDDIPKACGCYLPMSCENISCCQCSRPSTTHNCGEVASHDMLYESVFGAASSDTSDDSSVVGDLSDVRQLPTCGSQFNFVNNKQSCSFLSWNVNGLMSKLFDQAFVDFVSSFDFVCLVETFVDKLNYDIFNEIFVTFCCPAVKLSLAGRPSGGLICLIKREFVRFVKQIHVDKGPFLLFVIDKCVFNTSKDLLYVYMCVFTTRGFKLLCPFKQ